MRKIPTHLLCLHRPDRRPDGNHMPDECVAVEMMQINEPVRVSFIIFICLKATSMHSSWSNIVQMALSTSIYEMEKALRNLFIRNT